MDDLKAIKRRKKTIRRKKGRGDKKIKSPLIIMHKKKKRKTKIKPKEGENLKKPIGTSFLSHIFKSEKGKNRGRLRKKVEQKMEGMFFKGLRSDYITRKALNEVNEARKNEDINTIIDIGKVLLQKGEHQERSLKRLHGDKSDKRESKKCAEFREEKYGNFESCSLSPISGLTSSFVEDHIETLSEDKLDLEKEFKIFSEKYEETVGSKVLLRLPAHGVLEDALNAIRKLQETGQTDLESVTSEEFKGNETEFSKEFKFSVKDFEPENPAAEDFIKKFIFSDNLLLPKADYFYENFTGKSSEDELFMLNDEVQNYPHLSFQPMFDNDYEYNDFQDLACHSKSVESFDKDLSLTTPPIQFYRRNMF